MRLSDDYNQHMAWWDVLFYRACNAKACETLKDAKAVRDQEWIGRLETIIAHRENHIAGLIEKHGEPTDEAQARWATREAAMADV